MRWNKLELNSSNVTNTSGKYSFFDLAHKTIEIYVFIDPLCYECWSIEPYLKKLSIEFGRFFTIRPIISAPLRSLTTEQKPAKETHESHRENQSNDENVDQHHVSFPWVGLAIKAAELQGNNAGRTFLRKLQVKYFIKNKDISDKSVLIDCATESKLDVQEFKNDLFSESAKRAFQCDLKLKKEMDVDETPTIVFFNQDIEDHGIKISGIHPYKIYVQILSEMLQQEPVPADKPPLEDFLAYFNVVSTEDVSIVYDWNISEAERKLKKLQLKQVVKKISSGKNIFWKYYKKNN